MTDATSQRLVTRRLIPAAPERLFEAWTSPEHLRRWWGPPGGRCTRAAVDPVAGGRYQLDNELADGSTVIISGRFTLVDRPRQLAYTWRVEPGPGHFELVTVTFAAAGAGTEVTVEHVQIHDERSRDEHAAGWAACLDRLAAWAGPGGRAGS
jgi:uncharacterized protein YndB with AHSA1/START domain